MKEKEKWKEELYTERPFVLINNSGHYFEKFNKNIKNVLRYPTYEYLEKNIQKIIKSKQIVFLYETQERELGLLSTYLPAFKTPIYMARIINDITNSDKGWSKKELLNLIDEEDKEKERSKWLTFYIFWRLYKKYNWNPSYFYTCKNIEDMWKSLDLSQIDDYHLNKYLKNSPTIEPIIVLNLLLFNLEAYNYRYYDEYCDLIIKLIKGKELKEKRWKDVQYLIELLMRKGEVYRPKEGYIKMV